MHPWIYCFVCWVNSCWKHRLVYAVFQCVVLKVPLQFLPQGGFIKSCLLLNNQSVTSYILSWLLCFSVFFMSRQNNSDKINTFCTYLLFLLYFQFYRTSAVEHKMRWGPFIHALKIGIMFLRGHHSLSLYEESNC